MFQVGDILDQYRLTAEIGIGSYGCVFSAENMVTHQCFALKIVPLVGNAGRREMHALELYRDLDHPNLLKIHHVGTTADFLYYTMDLADGKLAEQKLAAPALLEAAAKIADALSVLHGAGLLHRDIKPDNLLWRRGEPLLGDLGLLTTESQATFTGTAGFLSPRILNAALPPDETTDLYAFAKSFYCLLSGNPPRRYPRYQGEMSPEASRLLRMALFVCDGEKVLSTASEVRDFLLQGRAKRIVPRRILLGRAWKTAVALLFAVGVATGAYFGIYRPLKARSLRLQEEQKRLAAQAEFDRWMARKKAAREYALKKIPLRRHSDGSTYTSMDDVIERSRLEREYLEKNP
ncbi:MAG: protein kinase [Victivallaceae bacterium]|nr:protein kinase [Victivallaceae bacterium]